MMRSQNETALAVLPVPLATGDETVQYDLKAAWAAWARGAAPNSVRAVKSDLTRYARFCHRLSRVALPADPETIDLYLCHLQADGLAIATLRRHLASIARAHILAGQPDPTKKDSITWRLKAFTREDPKPQGQAAPLRLKGDVDGLADRDPAGLCVLTLIQAAHHHSDTMTGPAYARIKRRNARDCALLSLAYDTGLRRSELVAVMVNQLTDNPDGSATLFVPWSKGADDGEGRFAFVSARSRHLIKVWIELVGIEEGPLFRPLTKWGSLREGALTPASVNLIYKRLIDIYMKGAGQDFSRDEQAEMRARISAHSTRIGMAQDLIATGADMAGIMQAMGWKSPTMPTRYGRQLAARNNAIAQMLKGEG